MKPPNMVISNLQKSRTARKVGKGKHTIQILPKRLSGRYRKWRKKLGKPSLELRHMGASVHAVDWQQQFLSRRWTLSSWEKPPVSILSCVLRSSNPFCLTFLAPTLPSLELPCVTFLVPARIVGTGFKTIWSNHQSPIYIIKSTMIETVFKLDCFLWGQLGFFFHRNTWPLHLMADY